MRIISDTKFRHQLAETIDSVVADHVPVIITRERDKPAVVLMSFEDFAAYEKTSSSS
jgi:antitoxin YefM